MLSKENNHIFNRYVKIILNESKPTTLNVRNRPGRMQELIYFYEFHSVAGGLALNETGYEILGDIMDDINYQENEKAVENHPRYPELRLEISKTVDFINKFVPEGADYAKAEFSLMAAGFWWENIPEEIFDELDGPMLEHFNQLYRREILSPEPDNLFQQWDDS
jgi:hypothetical protein